MYLPTTKKELQKLGWDKADIIILTGDTYIDSPFNGAAVVGKYLLKHGFRVAIIAQPEVDSDRDITRLGEPALFWGVTGGSVDSMVANYTASKKWRKQDDYTPGLENNRRPDRAVIAYSNLIRRYYKGTRPIVLGGIETSLRRIAHYDFWSNKIRKSILFDAKAEYLVYGMAERTVLELARCLRSGRDPFDIRGICYISKEKKTGALELPGFEKVSKDRKAFTTMFRDYYANSDPESARPLIQQYGDRYLVQNPPAATPDTSGLDEIYDIEYERGVHPFYAKMGKVKALDTIGFSITTHRGCIGECNYCSITVHQGRQVVSRSERSILAEARAIAKMKQFKGHISDAGGPTANMYGLKCGNVKVKGHCKKRRCLFPKICPNLQTAHKEQAQLLQKISRLSGIKKVYLASGIRHDLILHDRKHGPSYLKQVVENHVSGQLKTAPEHTEDKVLKLMGKPGMECLMKFKDLFYQMTNRAGKKQYLTYYIIAAHPGCTEKDMQKMKASMSRELNINSEQVQIFIPLPSTWSSVMYYTEQDPFTGNKLFVEKKGGGRDRQKLIAVSPERGGSHVYSREGGRKSRQGRQRR